MILSRLFCCLKCQQPKPLSSHQPFGYVTARLYLPHRISPPCRVREYVSAPYRHAYTSAVDRKTAKKNATQRAHSRPASRRYIFGFGRFTASAALALRAVSVRRDGQSGHHKNKAWCSHTAGGGNFERNLYPSFEAHASKKPAEIIDGLVEKLRLQT